MSMMTRFPHLCIHRPRSSGCLTIRHHALLLAHSCYIATLARPLLRAPLAMSQVKQCQLRSMWPSHSSHSWSLFSVATSWLLLHSLLSSLSQFHSQTLLCRPPRHVEFLMTLPPRRRTSLVPRYPLTLLPRRLPAVQVPHSWMLPCRRHHTVLFPGTFLRSLAIAQYLPSRLMWHCRLLPIVLCYVTQPHNLTSRSSSLAGFSLTVHWIIVIPFCQSPPAVQSARVVPVPPPGLVQPAPSPETATQTQSLANSSSSQCHTLQPTASTTNVGTHPVRPAGAKRSASTAHAGNHNSFGPCPRTEVTPFPKPNAVVLPMLNFGHSKTCSPCPIATADSDIMHHQFRLSLLQWNPGPARRNPTNIVSAACGKFHAVILQEASDHVPHIYAYFLAYTDNTDLAILLNKDTFEPDPIVTSYKFDSTSKNTWGMVLLIVRALLRRPSLSGSPTVTFCSVHIHNVVAKKRDASTELLQFFHSKMLEYNVDFIGGDFNMSAFSTVSDVFSDPEFSAPGHSCLWGLGALDEQHRECTGFLIMPKRPYEWRVDSHGCYKFDNAALGLGPRDQSAHLPVFLHLRNTNLPGPSSIMRSEQAQQRRYDRKHNKPECAKKRRP